MKRTIRLNEKELKNFINHTVKRILKEDFDGWRQDPMDWKLVNNSNDGDRLYKVGLWWGSGYRKDIYMVWAFADDEALDKVVAYINMNNPEILKASDDNAEAYLQQIMDEKGCDREEAQDSPEFTETFMYVDATMEGADGTYYIYSENLSIEEAPEEWKQKFLEREQSTEQLDEAVKNIVKGIINEIGDTPKGQYALGQLHARKVCRDPEFNSAIESPSKDMYDDIAKRRGGDDFDGNGKSKNPMFYDYANGYIDYMDNNPEDLLAAQRKLGLDEAVKRAIRKYLR